MNLYQCERAAERAHGVERLTFIAIFPVGPTECEWVDPYLGLFKIPMAGAGLFTTADVDHHYPDLKVFPTWANYEEQGDEAES